MILATLILTVTGGVTVTLPAKAQVHGTEIQLREVATVTGADAATIERILSIDLGYAPAPRYSRLLKREAIARALRLAVPDVEFQIEGAPSCRVAPEVERIEAARLQSVAEAELGRIFAAREVQITLKTGLIDLLIPRGTKPASVRVRPLSGELRPGLWSVPIEVVVDNDIYQTVWASMQVDMWETHLVLSQEVKRGQNLIPAMFRAARVRHDISVPVDLVPMSALVNAVAKRDLAAGSVVTDRDVERLRVIHKGDTITLEVKKGSITAKTVVVAMQEGRIGDRIRVVSSENRREVVAVVAGKDLVQISL